MFPSSVARFFALSLASGLALLWQIINGLPLNINPEVSTIKMLICLWWGNGKQTVQLNVGKTRERVVDFWRCLHSSPQQQTSITNPPTQLAPCWELTCEPVCNHVLLCFHNDLGKARQRNAHICSVGLCNTHRRHVSWAKWYRHDEQSDFVEQKPGTVKPSGENHSSSRKVCDVTWKGRKSGNNYCVLSFIEQQLWRASCQEPIRFHSSVMVVALFSFTLQPGLRARAAYQASWRAFHSWFRVSASWAHWKSEPPLLWAISSEQKKTPKWCWVTHCSITHHVNALFTFFQVVLGCNRALPVMLT